MSQDKAPAACIVTVDTRHASYVFRASAKWTITGKIEARASCTSGAVHAAIRCASKMFGLTDPSITQLEAELVLQEVSKFEKGRPGFRQWIVVLKGKGSAQDHLAWHPDLLPAIAEREKRKEAAPHG